MLRLESAQFRLKEGSSFDVLAGGQGPFRGLDAPIALEANYTKTVSWNPRPPQILRILRDHTERLEERIAQPS